MHTERVEQQLTVLTPSLTHQLMLANDATRELRKLGAKVTRQDLHNDGNGRPQLKIEGFKLDKLMPHLTHVVRSRNESGRWVIAHFRQVEVAFEVVRHEATL